MTFDVGETAGLGKEIVERVDDIAVVMAGATEVLGTGLTAGAWTGTGAVATATIALAVVVFSGSDSGR